MYKDVHRKVIFKTKHINILFVRSLCSLNQVEKSLEVNYTRYNLVGVSGQNPTQIKYK